MAVVDNRDDTGTGERVPLHTFMYGGSARPLLVTVFVLLILGVPGGAGYLLITRQASDLAGLLAIAAVFCLLSYVQLRERPLAYGTRAGLDLEWAWGKKRRIPWDDIRSVEATSLLGRFIGRRFRLELSQGAVELYARSDLPSVVARFQHPPPMA